MPDAFDGFNVENRSFGAEGYEQELIKSFGKLVGQILIIFIDGRCETLTRQCLAIPTLAQSPWCRHFWYFVLL